MANKDLYSVFSPNLGAGKERIKNTARKKYVTGDSKGVKVGAKAGIDDSSQDDPKRPGIYDTSELRAFDDPMVKQLTESYRKRAGLTDGPVDYGSGHSHTGGYFAKLREDWNDQAIPSDLEEIEAQTPRVRSGKSVKKKRSGTNR